ncbi:MAG: DUF481 domain-containing protein [Thiotrichales bacterium]|nr:DUF481 domain-containing protein [Thiotrichales bacterium]
MINRAAAIPLSQPKLWLLTAAFFCLSSQSVQVQAQTLTGSGELGYSDTSGNTESTALYGALKLNYAKDLNEIQTLLEANYRSENKVQTQERYLAEGQLNRYYDTQRSFYSFVGARFEHSKFEGIELDALYSIGLGKALYQSEATLFKAEAGLGYQTIEYTQNFGNGNEEQAIARLKGELTHTLNQYVELSQDLTLTSGSDNTKTEANSAVKVKLAEKLRLSAGYKYRYNTDPALGAQKRDTQTLLTLIYDF